MSSTVSFSKSYFYYAILYFNTKLYHALLSQNPSPFILEISPYQNNEEISNEEAHLFNVYDERKKALLHSTVKNSMFATGFTRVSFNLSETIISACEDRIKYNSDIHKCF